MQLVCRRTFPPRQEMRVVIMRIQNNRRRCKKSGDAHPQVLVVIAGGTHDPLLIILYALETAPACVHRTRPPLRPGKTQQFFGG
jgi:hypothetical protein